MKAFIFIVFAMLSLIGCANTSVVRTSAPDASPLSSTQDVTIFLKEADVKVPFSVVGSIHHQNFGKFQRLELADAIPGLKEKARALGANGIIIDDQSAIISGIFSRGIEVTARGIKY